MKTPFKAHRVMPDFVPTHRLTEEASLKMLAAGVKKANELGCKVSLAVVDQSCRLIGFLMMDGARHFSIITTHRKAITSASQKMPTGYAPEENALSMTVRMGDFTNVPGRVPITVAGHVIRAVGAGGGRGLGHLELRAAGRPQELGSSHELRRHLRRRLRAARRLCAVGNAVWQRSLRGDAELREHREAGPHQRPHRVGKIGGAVEL